VTTLRETDVTVVQMVTMVMPQQVLHLTVDSAHVLSQQHLTSKLFIFHLLHIIKVRKVDILIESLMNQTEERKN